MENVGRAAARAGTRPAVELEKIVVASVLQLGDASLRSLHDGRAVCCVPVDSTKATQLWANADGNETVRRAYSCSGAGTANVPPSRLPTALHQIVNIIMRIHQPGSFAGCPAHPRLRQRPECLDQLSTFRVGAGYCRQPDGNAREIETHQIPRYAPWLAVTVLLSVSERSGAKMITSGYLPVHPLVEKSPITRVLDALESSLPCSPELRPVLSR